MENKICSLINDILPLYLDQAISEESCQLIDEHLSSCESCKSYRVKLESIKSTTHQTLYSNSEELDKKELSQADKINNLTIKKVAVKLRKRRRVIILSVTTAFIFMFFLFTQVLQFSSIAGKGMEPTYSNMQQVLINKFSYQFTSPKRGDIVLINHNGNLNIKRIIGLPNETIEIQNSEIIMNGNPVSGKAFNIEHIKPIDLKSRVTLGVSDYFVLGDNTEYSIDSRYDEYGLVSQNEILGKVICKVPNLFKPKIEIVNTKVKITE